MIVKPITDYGWSVVNDKLTVVWDTDDNIKCVQHEWHSCCKTGHVTANVLRTTVNAWRDDSAPTVGTLVL